MSLPTPAPTNARIHELDALRGIAAMGVVLWHYGAHFHARPLMGLLYPFYNAGFLLVDFFFVLSGYVIARAYWRESRQQHPFRNIWARVARLYPLHLLTLLVTVLLVMGLPENATDTGFNQPWNDMKHLLLNLTLLNQSGLQDGWSFNTPAWSISTEFIVNVAFLAFLALAATARALLLCAAVAAIGALALWHPAWTDGLAFGVLDLNLLRCFVGFGAGVGVYWVLHRRHFARRIAANAELANMLGTASMLATLCLLAWSVRHPPAWHYLLSIAVAIGCVAFIPLGRFPRILLTRSPLIFLGDISYSTYLVHYPLQLALYSLSLRGLLDLDYHSPAVLVGFCASVIGISTLTQRYVERPAQRLLLDFASRRPWMARSE